jgi:hypothetical protein
VVFLLLALYPESDLARSRSALPVAARLLIVAGAIAFGLFAVILVPHAARGALARGRVIVWSDRLTIEDSALFRRPATVASSRITSLCIGPGVAAWLHKPPDGSSPQERQLSQFLDPPNLVIVLDRPVVIEDARGALKLHWYAEALPPHHSVPVVRLWGRLANPKVAFAAARPLHGRTQWVEEGIRPMDVGIVWSNAI